MVVLAVFAAAVLRFIDQPPNPQPAHVYWIFVVSAVVLSLITLIVFGLVLAVMWGYGTAFPASMQTWIEHADGLRASYVQYADVDGETAAHLERDLSQNVCEAADFNAEKNAHRSRLMVMAGRGLVLAAGALVVSGIAYLILGTKETKAVEVNMATPVSVQVVAPVPLGPLQVQGPVQLQPVHLQGPVEVVPAGPPARPNPVPHQGAARDR
ncbi:MAG: hypothetical protein QM704_21505 [Anaeromyxobacteraceae bacterium]